MPVLPPRDTTDAGAVELVLPSHAEAAASCGGGGQPFRPARRAVRAVRSAARREHGRGNSHRHPAVAGALRQLRLAELDHDHPRVRRDRPSVVCIGAPGAQPAGSAEPPALVRRRGDRLRGAVGLPELLACAQLGLKPSAHERGVQPVSPDQHLRRLRQHRPYSLRGGDRRHRPAGDHRPDGVEGIRVQRKPGDPHRLPRQWAPYHLRLDWLMWFAALTPLYARDWLGPFVIRLLQNDPPTLRLLRHNPFPDSPPRYVRARLYEYRFT